MALPAGALTATVTVGGSVGIAGTTAVVSDFSVALDLPGAGKQSPGLVWAATGEAVNSFAETDAAGSIVILADQPGVLASSTVNGAAALVEVRGWPLVARWRVTSGGASSMEMRRFAAPAPGATVDVDMLPRQGVVAPGTVTYAQTITVGSGDPAAIAQAVDDYLTANPPAAPVTSVNAEVGAVVLSAADVGADPAGTAAAAVAAHAGAVDPHPTYTTAAEAAAAAPVQTVAGRAGAVVLAVADVSGAVATTDGRLSDARTPTAHAGSHATGQADAITPASIGAAATSHTHTLDQTTDTATRLALAPAERTKLGGVATGATANASDAALRDRATHTGTQAIATVTGLQTALDGKAASLGSDDNYVTDAEKAALHSHANAAALAAVSGTNTGDQTLPTWSTILGKPAVIGAGADATAARAAIGAGTSSLALGTTAGTAAAGNDARLSDARTPTAHNHAAGDVTSGTFAAARLPAATETAIGAVELATTAEATTGTDTTRAVTPAGVKAVADTKAAASHTHPATGISDSTTVGRTLVTAADAAAARSAIGAGTSNLTTEDVQDTIGGMVVGAGGTYDDGAGSITLPSGGGGAPPTPPFPGNVYAPGGGSLGGSTGGLNVEVGYPSAVLIRIERDRTIVNVIFEVRNAGSGRTAHVGVWAADGTASKPGTLVITTGSVSTDTTGVKTVAVTPTVLTAGYYWVGMQVSSDTEIEGCDRAVSLHALAADRYGVYSALQAMGAWATPLTSNPACASFSNRAPWIRLEASA